jgi:molecular chaperone DnaJ
MKGCSCTSATSIAMLAKSYYLTLGIPRSESAEGVRRAFRDQIKRYHPDRLGPARLEFFDRIVEAYRVLSNPERRRDYDRGLCHSFQSGENGGAGEPVPSTPERTSGLPQVASTLRARCIKAAPFESALAQVSQNLISSHIPERGSPERLSVIAILSPAEALRGGTLDLAVPGCSPCMRCGGTGMLGFFPCDLCDAEGLLEEEDTVHLRVPANVADGSLIELPLRTLGLHNFYLCVQIRVAP